MSSPDVAVIGAGHNGLTAGALLAKAGRQVLILERRSIVGGLAAGEEFHPGFRSAGLLHDTAGLRPEVVSELELERHGLALTPRPPAVFAPAREGRGLLLEHSPSGAAAELGALSSGDAERYREYREFLGRVSGVANRFLLEAPPDLHESGLGPMIALARKGLAVRRLGRRDLTQLFRMIPMSAADWLGEWFESEMLACLLAGPALLGSFLGPYSPGAGASLLRSEVGAGRAAGRGPQAVIDALEAAARAQGAEIRTDAQVRGIRVSQGRVTGVTLAGGEEIDVPVVAASCDPKQVFLELIAAAAVPLKLEHRISKYRDRGMSAKVHLALNSPLRFECRPEHEVVYARTGEKFDELERAFDAAKYGQLSDTPWLDIFVPSVVDPALAPRGHHVVSILAHFAPYELRAGWTDEMRERLGDAVLEALGRYAPSIGESVVAREVLTPADIESRYAVTGGHILHGEHALDQLLARPTPECARFATPIAGLFLCGAGAHPGGGITAAPGAAAAAVVQKTT